MEEPKTINYSDYTNPDSDYNKNLTKKSIEYLNSILEGFKEKKVYRVSFNPRTSSYGFGYYFHVGSEKQLYDVFNILFNQEVNSAKSWFDSVAEAKKNGQVFYDGMIFSTSSSRREKAEKSKSLEDIYDFIQFVGFNRLRIVEITEEKEKSWDYNQYNDYDLIGKKYFNPQL
jgi:hypothetical protein